MSVTPEEREAVKSIGRSVDWPRKVDRMPDEQIKAIYIRLENQGKL